MAYDTQDVSVLVRMANFAVAESGRTVDWLHLAGPRYLRSEDDRFFDFGVAMYCGFGRQPGRDGSETMREHRDVARTVRR